MKTITILPVAGFRNLRFWRFGNNRRLVCRFEWLTFQPVETFFPVTIQLFTINFVSGSIGDPKKIGKTFIPNS